METHNDKIKATIGKVTLKSNVSNSFPLVGEEVEINSETK
jgi:hypothetical protein